MIQAARSLLDDVISVVKRFKDYTQWTDTNSLPEVTKLTRVEPLSIISKDILNMEQLPDVQNVMLSLFCAYYLQAVSLFSRVQDVEVVKILDRLNPDRDSTAVFYSLESARTLSLENYKYSLPMTGIPALEDENTKMLNDIASLSVGKQLDVRIEYDHKENKVTDLTENRCVNIPVSVRLLASVIGDATVINLLAGKGEDKSLTERWHAWRAGRISFIRDLILCQDLIDESKKAMIEDETGTVHEIMRRVTNAKKFGIINENPSLVSASNLFVISKELATEIEQKIGGKFSSATARRKIFDNTYAMIIAVVDRDYERVVFYTRGVEASTNVSFKDVKAAARDKGPNILELMKSMSGMPGPLSI